MDTMHACSRELLMALLAGWLQKYLWSGVQTGVYRRQCRPAFGLPVLPTTLGRNKLQMHRLPQTPSEEACILDA